MSASTPLIPTVPSIGNRPTPKDPLDKTALVSQHRMYLIAASNNSIGAPSLMSQLIDVASVPQNYYLLM